MEQAEDVHILNSFKKFVIESNLIEKHDLDCTIDQTIGSYIVNTIKQFYEEYENHKIWLDDNAEEEFDIDNFVEILDAYLNGFSDLSKNSITKWLIQLKNEIDKLQKEQEKFENSSSNKSEHVLTETQYSDESKTNEKLNDIELNTDTKILVEMFPNVNLKEIEKIYKKSNKNNEKAIEELLLIQNRLDNEVIIDRDEELTEEEKRFLKEQTVKKFGMVEIKEDGTPIEVKPKFVWNSEKKLIRYYESKVVTTRGEKKFEYKTEQEEEMEKQMKATYINLKPARKYRFH
ncbi:unnamed protein product [Brachionus calyciflorus]|uniref:CUE domain-containing protein n=1 Tax=Brachionus calyciflorus TaxID=104777 RepID=A0A813M631_9BILA|nr:unnamed protein product [Brachionus calyciflorus]